MVCAICVRVPMASMVTMAPASSSRRSSSGMAIISSDFSETRLLPSTSCWPAAQAETVCSGPRPLDRAWLPRGLAVDCDHIRPRYAQSLDPVAEAGFEQVRVDGDDHLAQRVVAREAARRAETAQEGQVLLAPQRQF